MPIEKKEFDIDGTKVMVRQASGLEKLKIEAIHARCLRKCRDFGLNPTDWTDEQMETFLTMIEEEGGGLVAQAEEWIPKCVIGGMDPNELTTEELLPILQFIKGEAEIDLDGASPLE
jgi:hypothetical protein